MGIFFTCFHCKDKINNTDFVNKEDSTLDTILKNNTEENSTNNIEPEEYSINITETEETFELNNSSPIYKDFSLYLLELEKNFSQIIFDEVALHIKSGNLIITDENNVELFWHNYSEYILNFCVYYPPDILKFGINLLDHDYKCQLIHSFAIKIYNTEPDQAILMCKDNISLISYYISKKNLKLSRMLDCKNINESMRKKIMLNAYTAMSKHKFGLAYVLFKLINDKKGLKQIYENNVPEYLKKLINFNNDFE